MTAALASPQVIVMLDGRTLAFVQSVTKRWPEDANAAAPRARATANVMLKLRVRDMPATVPEGYVMMGMIRIATMLATLIIGLIAGPDVSLNGSPTVSPVTDAAWASEPLP